jgi:hypothetical protein
MNCQRFENVVADLARGRMMEADVRNAASAHGDECESCAARLRDEETLTRGLQLLALDMETMSAPSELEGKLREAFRSRRVVVPMPAKRAPSRYWLVAVAAALLIAMGAIAMWWRAETPEQRMAEAPPSPAKQEQAVNPKPQPVENVQPANDENYHAVESGQRRRETPKLAQQVAHRTGGARRAAATPLANHATPEIATDFMPLGDVSPASLQDGGQIVRVKLRRATLVTFGIPVNMDRYNEDLKADVLIGIDGRARAIRFVQ